MNIQKFMIMIVVVTVSVVVVVIIIIVVAVFVQIYLIQSDKTCVLQKQIHCCVRRKSKVAT